MQVISDAGLPARNHGKPDLAEHAARVCAKRQFRQARGMLPSEKMRAPVPWTTQAQRDAMVVLEFEHGVVSFETWPLQVTVPAGSAWFPYSPSLGITLADGRKVALDIFREEDGSEAEHAAFGRALAPALAAAGYGMKRTGEGMVRADRCIANARDALRASGCPVDGRTEFECVRRLSALGGAATLDALSAGKGELSARYCVLAMRRVLAIDLRARSPGECVVRLPAERP